MDTASLALLSNLWLHEPDESMLALAREGFALPAVASTAELAMAYTDLFLLNVYPYGTAYTDAWGELNTPEARSIRAKFEAHGYRPKELLETGAPDHLEHHAADKEIPVREKPPAEIAAEQVQAVIESAKHAHQGRGHFHRQLEMLRRVKDERRIKNREAERREDLNEEERGRPLRSFREETFFRIHRALSCRPPARAMSS